MRHTFTRIALLSLACVVLACGSGSKGEEPIPRLVVLAVVDQLPSDLLMRYDSCFTGGLRRLLDVGFVFENAEHDHAVTNTAPGHATLSTGALPSQHGIVDNSWYEHVDEGYVSVAAVTDTTTTILGQPEMRGASPRNLRASTFAEWLQEQYPDARVVSVGGKDRSAIFLTGRARGHVYWFSREAGGFVTTSWYSESDPDWVGRFRDEVWPSFSADSVWVNTTPDAFRELARHDDAAYESATEPAFPHRFTPPAIQTSIEPSATAARDSGAAQADTQTPKPMTDEDRRARTRAFWRWFYGTPRVDAAVLEFAKAALHAEQLGQDETPDYLAVALSATDVIGHDFGPLSQEQLNNLLHLDRALGEFFDLLDAEVGAEHWVLALSADHGVATMPEQLQHDGIEAQRVPREEIEELFADLQAAVGVYEQTRVLSSEAELQRVLATRARATHYVAAAMPRLELAMAAATAAPMAASATEAADRETERTGLHETDRRPAALMASPDDPFVRLYANSYFEGRMLGGPLSSREQRRSLGTYGVEARLVDNFNVHRTAAMHGSPYRHDRHVPLIFMGHTVAAGRSDEAVRTVDLAPTLAQLLDVVAPPDRAGRVLSMRKDE